MGLIKKDKKKKSFDKIASRGGAGADISTERPQYVEKVPPCIDECPSGNDIRKWLTTIAQREKLGKSLDEAWTEAWFTEVETNPFPAIMGRVCPHPCETVCNRKEKDGAVAINSVERTIGDWGIQKKLELPKLDAGGPYDEKIAIVGSGPSGMSCAYQLARRGYKVTVFEAFEKAGGMLRYGIPEYRLPRNVLEDEYQKILDLGVDIKFATRVGTDVTLEDLQKEYQAVFVGIGAHRGKTMGIPGEDGPGVFTGTDFLNKANSGEKVDVGGKVVVVGGGDTAIDAARVSARVFPKLSQDSAQMSRRLGAEVTILYRRTRKEMPAIEHEIDEALTEGINIEYLAAPAKIERDRNGKIGKVTVQRFELGEPDDSGRRRPVPIEGDVYDIQTDSIIMAVSQQPDWSDLGAIVKEGSWLEIDDWGRTKVEGVWSGGDALTIGLATISIGQGRKAAESIHATLRGIDSPGAPNMPATSQDRIKMDWYEAAERAQRDITPPEDRLAKPFEEIDRGVTAEQAVDETSRCFSCGLCFGCDNCWMYCQSNCFKRIDEKSQGHYFDIDISVCDGCKKCAEECPCGFIDMV
jgi:NADPH-dependent glutamate synthase beta subunit-like oxidoreductase/Pyruvate/2-oxoacid:ferredoxin oxidoreductase delta subunit